MGSAPLCGIGADEAGRYRGFRFYFARLFRKSEHILFVGIANVIRRYSRTIVPCISCVIRGPVAVAYHCIHGSTCLLVSLPPRLSSLPSPLFPIAWWVRAYGTCAGVCRKTGGAHGLEITRMCVRSCVRRRGVDSVVSVTANERLLGQNIVTRRVLLDMRNNCT